jgi:hypothetical protein
MPLVRCFHFFSADGIDLRVCNDDIILGVELVDDSWIFFINKVLLFEFELEFIYFVWFNLNKSYADLNHIYNSSQPFRWFYIFAIGITVVQLFHEPIS